jgi:hypothetical protein
MSQAVRRHTVSKVHLHTGEERERDVAGSLAGRLTFLQWVPLAVVVLSNSISSIQIQAPVLSVADFMISMMDDPERREQKKHVYPLIDLNLQKKKKKRPCRGLPWLSLSDDLLLVLPPRTRTKKKTKSKYFPRCWELGDLFV